MNTHVYVYLCVYIPKCQVSNFFAKKIMLELNENGALSFG